MDAITSVLQGGCSCGDVQFEIRGKPIELVQCDCKRCSRASNGEAASTLLVERADFHWLNGKTHVITLQRQDEDRDASTAVCRRCGSELPRVHSELPVVLVPTGSLHHFEAGGVGVAAAGAGAGLMLINSTSNFSKEFGGIGGGELAP